MRRENASHGLSNESLKTHLNHCPKSNANEIIRQKNKPEYRDKGEGKRSLDARAHRVAPIGVMKKAAKP
jgi:hypothetical protein